MSLVAGDESNAVSAEDVIDFAPAQLLEKFHGHCIILSCLLQGVYRISVADAMSFGYNAFIGFFC